MSLVCRGENLDATFFLNKKAKMDLFLPKMFKRQYFEMLHFITNILLVFLSTSKPFLLTKIVTEINISNVGFFVF